MTELPTTFGKYFLTEKLATGGMAEIYLAKLVGPGGFEKQLVIKQIHPNLSGQRHFVDLFVTEAKTLVTLAHGNIVPVYELGVIGDTYFIAMEYIDGPTLYRLTERINQRDDRMTPTLAAWITARILEGLDYAHRKGDGVIHRDLSPRNVMLSRDGEVKLVDFGIAVTLGADAGEAAQSAPTGSFPYMSPEQVRREALTPQTDLFSVGVLMWEMLVGQRLFARPDADATLAAVTSSVIPRPSAQLPEIPEKLDDLVMRALERDTTLRWATAGDMLAALQRYLYSLDDTPTPRDVGALVARFCPPETRRQPTNLELIHDPPSGPVAGPQTAVISRDGRSPRQQTFATHVDLEGLLDRATPMFPIPALVDPAEPTTTVTAPRPAEPSTPAERADTSGVRRAARAEREPAPVAEPTTTVTAPRPAEPAAATTRTPAERADTSGVRRAARAEREGEPAVAERVDRPPDGYVPVRLGMPGRDAPGRGGIFVAGLGAIALSAGAIWIFYQGRDAVLAQDEDARPLDPMVDAMIDASAPLDAVESAPDAPGAGMVDASAAAAPPPDAPPRPPRDALVHPDARGVPAGDARITATATLKIGADPWGEITIDGVPRGRTPAVIAVPVGHHVVEISYPPDPPSKRTFPIDVAANETLPLQADFTKP